MKELKDKFLAGEWVNVEWTDSVLAELKENEVAVGKDGKKYPRVKGLRRIGSFLSEALIDCDVIVCNTEYAACKATAFKQRENNTEFVLASSMAEATPANVNNDMIAKHLLATAESRAEGRCWTKVLKLNCLTAEEMSLADADADSNKNVDIDEGEKWFSDTQKKMINNKSKKLNINPIEYAKLLVELDEEMDIKSDIKNNTLSRKLAARLIDALDKVIKEGKVVPDNLQGFVSL